MLTAAVQLSDSLQRGLDSLIGFLPRLIGFLVILLIGWLIARVVKALVVKALHGIGVDRALSSGGDRHIEGGCTHRGAERCGEVQPRCVRLLAGERRNRGLPALRMAPHRQRLTAAPRFDSSRQFVQRLRPQPEHQLCLFLGEVKAAHRVSRRPGQPTEELCVDGTLAYQVL